jgi:Mor family transcriptional regulator
MTRSRITFEELCEAWRCEHRPEDSGHLASSALFDLLHQSPDDEEKKQILRHLAECTACLQNLEAMLKIKGLVLTVEEPLAAAIP